MERKNKGIPPEDHIGVAFHLFDNEQISIDEALNRAVSQLSKANTEAHRDRLKQQIKNEWSNVSNQPFPKDVFKEG
jgi:hypothetical protein